MDDMQAVYDEEVNGRSGGLLSLLRAPVDIGMDESIMDNLPTLLRAMEGTNKDTLTMQETRDMSGPIDETSLSVQLSEAPGILSMLEDSGYGTAATMLGMVGGGGKGRSAKEGFDEIIERIKKLAAENRQLQSQRDMDVTRNEYDPNRPEFLKSFSQLRRERTDREMYEDRPSRNMPRDPDLDKGLGSLDPTMQDAVDKAGNIRNPSYVIEEMQDNVDSFGRGIKSKNITSPALTREQGDEALARLGEREQMQIRALRDQHRKAMKEVFGPDRDPMSFEKEQEILEKLSELDRKLSPYFIRSDLEMMASGGRPGLYANIAAKRKRIASGSGEKMRKAGSKGAPTKENFRQAATTAKKANGGGLSYAKGYYGKSYK